MAVAPEALRLHLAHRSRVYRDASALVDAVRLRFGNALKLALLAQVRGKDAENIEKALPRGCAGVDRLLRCLQRGATGTHLANDVLQVGDTSGEAIDPRHNQDVARMEKIEDDPQLTPPLGGRAATLLGADHVASNRPQGG